MNLGSKLWFEVELTWSLVTVEPDGVTSTIMSMLNWKSNSTRTPTLLTYKDKPLCSEDHSVYIQKPKIIYNVYTIYIFCYCPCWLYLYFTVRTPLHGLRRITTIWPRTCQRSMIFSKDGALSWTNTAKTSRQKLRKKKIKCKESELRIDTHCISLWRYRAAILKIQTNSYTIIMKLFS